MKKSNKVLLFTLTFMMIILLVLIINVKPDYINISVRNISDSFRIVSIECENMNPEQINFSEADAQKDTYIYWMKDKQMATTSINLHENKDTLFVKLIKINGESLHIHLKGIEEIYLNGEKINIDNIEK